MDSIQLASMTGDFLAELLELKDEVDLCSVLRPDNVVVAGQRIQLKEIMPTTAFVPVSGFAAPEQYVAGNCERAPVYFVGALLYTLLYGTPPPDARKRLTDGQKLTMSTTALSGVITCCLELYPGDRYANLGRVLWELNEILEADALVRSEEKRIEEKQKIERKDDCLLGDETEKETGNNRVEITQKNTQENSEINIQEKQEKEAKKIQLESRREAQRKERGKKQNKKKMVAICIGLVVCMVLGYTLWQGQKAQTALEEGAYSEVVSSLNYAPWLRLTRNDSYLYASAQQLWEQGNYEEAQALFVEIPDYADSAQMVQEIQYDKGLLLVEALLLDEAKLVFDSLQGLEDSAEQSARITAYQQAEMLEDPTMRYTAFLELGEYANSAQRAQEAAAEVYALAKTNYEADNLAEAARLFGVIGNYQDAAVYKQLCDLWQVASDEAAENRAALTAVMAYGDVANLEPVVMSDRFFMIFLEGNWTSANGGGEMSFEEDAFRAPLLNVAGNTWTFDTRSIHNEGATAAVFDYISPNEITMTVSDTGETFTYQRLV